VNLVDVVLFSGLDTGLSSRTLNGCLQSTDVGSHGCWFLGSNFLRGKKVVAVRWLLRFVSDEQT
jgi:hypothetical protein